MNAAPKPTSPKTAPVTNNYWAPNGDSSEAEKAWVTQAQTARWGVGPRGYLAPHLGHIKFEIFM